MDDFNYLCPVCRAQGNTTFLSLYQINFTTAVYLCKNIRCSYPQGYSWIYVNKTLFNDNLCDSDLSDSVNKDIEKMQNSIKEDYKLKPTETRNYNIICVLKPNEEKFNETKYQENINVSLSAKTDDPITNILEKSVDREDNTVNYKLNYNLSADIQTDLSITDVHPNLSLQELPAKITASSTCNNETLLFTATENKNIIIDEFCFPKSILQEALETAKEDENKIRPKKNKSSVNLLLGENKAKTRYTNNDSPSFYDGYKFSPKSIKTATSTKKKTKKITKKKTKEPIIREQIKEKLDESNCNIKLNSTKSVQKELTTVKNNACVSSESTNNNSNLEEECLNEFLDNIDEHEHVNNPDRNMYFKDIEELLLSLCH